MKFITSLSLILTFGLMAFGQEKMPRMNHQSKAEEHLIAIPDSIKWEKNYAVVSGDPNKEGSPFVIRFKFPDGAKIAPHWHPTDENITVISGTLFMGMGEKFDETKAKEMPVGSFGLMPKEMRHFGWAKGETIIQIHGIGPFKIFWVETQKK